MRSSASDWSMIVKSARQAGGLAEAAEQPVRGGVEGAAVHGAARAPDEALGAAEHLLRGTPRERQEEDAFRADPRLEQVRDAVHQRARLARAGSGDDQQRSVGVRRRLQLRRIQLGGEVRRAPRLDFANAGRVDARAVLHEIRI